MDFQSAAACLLVDPPCRPVISSSQSELTMEDKLSLREIFEAEESSLPRYAHGIVGQREIAEDLVQDAFLKLHQHWDEVAHLRAWLFRSIRNLALNHLRDHKRESPLEEEREWQSPAPDPTQNLVHQEAIGTLQLLILELHEDERQLITLKYNEGLKYEQISARTGLTISNVGYKLHHTLKHLAASLRKLGIENSDT